MSKPFNKHPLTLAIGSAIVLGSAAFTGCSSDSETVYVAPAGNYTINTSGGNGGSLSGDWAGSGGEVNIYLDGGAGGIKITKSGKADAAFTSQMSKVTPFLGSNPLVVSADTTIEAKYPQYTYTNTQYRADGAAVPNVGYLYVGSDKVLRTAAALTTNYATDAKVSDNRLYTLNSSILNEQHQRTLFVAVGDDATPDVVPAGTYWQNGVTSNLLMSEDDTDTTQDSYITGIQIDAGKTLTIGLTGQSGIYVSLQNDLVNKGTLASLNDNVNQRDYLGFDVSSYLGSGTIDTAGTGSAGQDGNHVEIWADFALINKGAINSSGANNIAGAGGDAGYIDINSGYYFENTAAVTAKGGDGTGSNGGRGNYVDIYATYGSVNNSGDINTSGGNGSTYGGAGDWIWMGNGGSAKAVRNSGDLTAMGGNGVTSNGGHGDDIGIYAYGAGVVSSGNLTSKGGEGTDGNWGGSIYLYNGNGYAGWGYATTAQGDVVVSGNIDTSGGSAVGTNANYGESGGGLYLWTDAYDYGNEETATDQKIALLGYKSIDATGGDAQDPGYGGDVYLYAAYAWNDASYSASHGPVLNEANIDVSAGNLSAGAVLNNSGAYAGDIYMETTYYYGDLNPKTKVTNRGNLTMNGGTARNSTSSGNNRGGGIWAWGYNGVTNSGTITANGGDDLAVDLGTAGYGGRSGWIELYSELGPVTNSAAITVNGGNGEVRGGSAHSWTGMYGPSVKSSGTLKGKGGDANAALANSLGGYGGYVWLMGTDGPNAVTHGTITMTPGTGNITGQWARYSTSVTDPVTETNGYDKVVGSHCEGDCN